MQISVLSLQNGELYPDLVESPYGYHIIKLEALHDGGGYLTTEETSQVLHEEFEEQAVKCTHPRGKEKYIAQLDNFLANGLIDKAEYRVLKERYEKTQVPDNMH